MTESSLKGWKTLWEKEKLLIMINFSFSHNVLKRLARQTRKIKSLFGKGSSHISCTVHDRTISVSNGIFPRLLSLELNKLDGIVDQDQTVSYL